MGANALDSCVVRSSKTMVLTMQYKQTPVFSEEGFKLPARLQELEMKENAFSPGIQFELTFCGHVSPYDNIDLG